MASPEGTWEINANGYRGQLVIGAVDGAGNLRGSVFGEPIEGSWDETAQKITFTRNKTANPLSAQVYTGFHFYSNAPLFKSSGPGGIDPPVEPFQFRVLTGFFGSSVKLVGRRRDLDFEPVLGRERDYGWMARMMIG